METMQRINLLVLATFTSDVGRRVGRLASGRQASPRNGPSGRIGGAAPDAPLSTDRAEGSFNDLFRDQPSGAEGNRHGQVESSERSVGLHLISGD
jgi:hypothetical protein